MNTLCRVIAQRRHSMPFQRESAQGNSVKVDPGPVTHFQGNLLKMVARSLDRRIHGQTTFAGLKMAAPLLDRPLSMSGAIDFFQGVPTRGRSSSLNSGQVLTFHSPESTPRKLTRRGVSFGVWFPD